MQGTSILAFCTKCECLYKSTFENKYVCSLVFGLCVLYSSETELKEAKDNRDVSGTEDLELDLENLDITDEALELDCGDEAEDLTKKLLDEQGKNEAQNKLRLLLTIFYKLSL